MIARTSFRVLTFIVAGISPAAAVSAERAFGVLEKLVEARETSEPGGESGLAIFDHYDGQFSAASLAGSLLPAVEAVDPSLVPEYAWRAVSFRLPRVGDEAQQINARRANAALAMMLARYNREVADAVLTLGQRYGGGRDPGLAALALIDPARAAAAIEKELDPDQADCAARAELADLLVLEGDALWRKLNGILALWSIDVEDIFRKPRRQGSAGACLNVAGIAAHRPAIGRRSVRPFVQICNNGKNPRNFDSNPLIGVSLCGHSMDVARRAQTARTEARRAAFDVAHFPARSGPESLAVGASPRKTSTNPVKAA